MSNTVQSFFDPKTCSYSYVVADFTRRTALIIDPVLDYEPNSGQTSTGSADALIHYIASNELTVEWILETHIHADHLSAAGYLWKILGGKIGIGAGVAEVQSLFEDRFNFEPGSLQEAKAFDTLFEDGDRYGSGSLAFRVLDTPGHTAACVTYLFEGYAFVGDTVFMPDYGTARADFPGGSARTLYRSIQKILALPEDTTLYLCHDYGTDSRSDYKNTTTVADQRNQNRLVNANISENEFVANRERRDSTLKTPALFDPAVPFNLRAGLIPLARENSQHSCNSRGRSS